MKAADRFERRGPKAHWQLIASVALAGWLFSGATRAADAIGTALAIEGQVSGLFGGRTSSLAKGDGVVSDEVLRSQAASSGEIGFVDQTRLFLGPSSTVKLDRFVFDQSGTASRMTVDIGRGALRFISGRSPHGAYQVKTPLGSLGMRGTTADVVIGPGRVYVTDQRGPNQGPITVTALNGRSITLLPGQSVILTRAGIVPSGGQSVPDFTTACAGCTILGFLDITPRDPAGPGNAGIGGPGEKGGQQGSSGSSSSDIRLKRDVRLVAVLPSGIRLYRFRYRWSDETYVGVIAQEVRKVRPDAVSQGVDGYLRVDYARLGLHLMPLREWVKGKGAAALDAVSR
jgi:hypothetical protein